MGRPHPALIALAAGREPGVPHDLDALCESAIEHRMGGLLWSEVLAGRLTPGESWMERLSRQDLTNRFWQRRLWEALAHVNRKLLDIGVEVATFKGVTATARWYDREGERPCADLDLLVAPADHHRAGEIVAALEPDHRLAQSIQPLVDSGALQSVDLTVGDVAVDLHFDLLKYDIRGRQEERIWERTSSFELPAGGSVRVLDAETSLVQLLLHLNKDRFRYLLGFVDIARILARERLDWEYVHSFIAEEGLDVPLYLTLDVVTQLLGIDAPPHPKPGGWRAVIWRRMWPPEVRLRGDVGVARFRNRQRWIPVMARGRLFDGMGSWLRYLFPPRALMDYYFPETAGPYLLRNVQGRLRHSLGRRRATARLRAAGPPDRERAEAPGPEDA